MVEKKVNDYYKGVETWIRVFPDDYSGDLWKILDSVEGKIFE